MEESMEKSFRYDTFGWFYELRGTEGGWYSSNDRVAIKQFQG